MTRNGGTRRRAWVPRDGLDCPRARTGYRDATGHARDEDHALVVQLLLLPFLCDLRAADLRGRHERPTGERVHLAEVLHGLPIVIASRGCLEFGVDHPPTLPFVCQAVSPCHRGLGRSTRSSRNNWRKTRPRGFVAPRKTRMTWVYATLVRSSICTRGTMSSRKTRLPISCPTVMVVSS